MSRAIVERTQRGLRLREQHQPAALRGDHALLQRHVLAQQPFDQRAIDERDLAGDIQEPARLDRGDIGRNRRGGGGDPLRGDRISRPPGWVNARMLEYSL